MRMRMRMRRRMRRMKKRRRWRRTLKVASKKMKNPPFLPKDCL
jgi:hypothetical protein